MATYKITYFDARSLIETSRLILNYAKQPFEDVRMVYNSDAASQWFAENRKDLTFGQLPLFEGDGIRLTQSCAIARYLARKYGLAGKGSQEEAFVDSVADAQKDFCNEVQPFIVVVGGYGEGDRDKLLKEAVEPALAKFLPMFEKLITASGTGFFAKSSVTWADFFVAEFIQTLFNILPKIATQYPWTAGYLKRVHSLPEIKDYVAKRPVTTF